MTDKSWRSAKLFIMKNYTYIVDRGYGFNYKVCDIFSFFEFSECTFILGRRNADHTG